MNFILEQMAAVVIGGLLILAIIGLNFQMNNASYDKFAQSMMQQVAVNTMEIIESDIYHLGYRVTSDKFSLVDSIRLIFYTDLITETNPEGDGIQDEIEYYVGLKSDMSDTPNENDFPLYRRVNGNAPLMIGIVTSFKLTYQDNLGNLIDYNDLGSTGGMALIKGIYLQIQFESPEEFDGSYQNVTSRKLISPKNLMIDES